MFGPFKKDKNLKYFKMKPAEVQEAAGVVHSMLEQWLGFKRFFLKAFTTEPLAPDDESTFLEVKAQLARSMRSLGEKINEKEFYFGGDKANALLRQCVSVNHLRSLPFPDRRLLYKDWHTVFVHLSRTVGAFKFLAEGYVPPPKKMAPGGNATGGTSVASIKAAGAAASAARKR